RHSSSGSWTGSPCGFAPARERPGWWRPAGPRSKRFSWTMLLMNFRPDAIGRPRPACNAVLDESFDPGAADGDRRGRRTRDGRRGGAGRGTRCAARSVITIAVAIAIPVAVALAVTPAAILDLQHFQRRGVELGLEGAAFGVLAADFIAAVVDLDALQVPAFLAGHRGDGLAGLPTLDGHVAVIVGGRRHGEGRQRHGQQAGACPVPGFVHDG